MKKLASFAIAAAMLCSSLPAFASTVTVYTNKAAFQAASGTVVTENFADTTLVSGLHIAGTAPQFSISGGRLNDRLAEGLTTVFSFDSALRGFGANFDLSAGGSGMGLAITLNGGAIVNFLIPTEVPATQSGGFFGFISDTSFSSVTLRAGSAGGAVAETYSLDDVVFANAVPEPATITIMLAGLALLGANARRGKRK